MFRRRTLTQSFFAVWTGAALFLTPVPATADPFSAGHLSKSEYLRIAEGCHARNEFELAVINYEQCLRIDPSSTEIQTLKDAALRQIGLDGPAPAEHPGYREEVTDFIANMESMANAHNLAGVSQDYSEDFSNDDGLTKSEMLKAIAESWKTFPDFTASYANRNISINGDSAIASSVQTCIGTTAQQIPGVGFGSAQAITTGKAFLHRGSNGWKIVALSKSRQDIRVDFGNTRGQPFTLTAPESCAAGSQFEVQLQGAPPRGCSSKVSVCSMLSTYPAQQPIEKFQTPNNAVPYIRTFAANTHRKNEIVRATAQVFSYGRLVGECFVSQNLRVTPPSDAMVADETVTKSAVRKALSPIADSSTSLAANATPGQTQKSAFNTFFPPQGPSTASSYHRPVNNSATQSRYPVAPPQPSQSKQTNGLSPGLRAEIKNRKPDSAVKDKWALVIGITHFAHPAYDLKYAAKDAQDFYNYLIHEAHFRQDHVLMLLDDKATKVNIMEAFGEKFLPAVTEDGDLVVVYVSTHGTPANKDKGGRNYIVAYDTDIDKLYGTGVDMDEINRRVKESVKSDRVLIVMDTCYSGGGVPGAKGMSRAGNFDADVMAEGSGHLVISSSSPMERSWESSVTPNGVFTKYLLQALRKNAGNTDVKSAFQDVEKNVGWEVKNAYGETQTPKLGGNWEGKELILSVPPVEPRPVFNRELLEMMSSTSAPGTTTTRQGGSRAVVPHK